MGLVMGLAGWATKKLGTIALVGGAGTGAYLGDKHLLNGTIMEKVKKEAVDATPGAYEAINSFGQGGGSLVADVGTHTEFAGKFGTIERYASLLNTGIMAMGGSGDGALLEAVNWARSQQKDKPPISVINKTQVVHGSFATDSKTGDRYSMNMDGTLTTTLKGETPPVLVEELGIFLAPGTQTMDIATGQWATVAANGATQITPEGETPPVLNSEGLLVSETINYEFTTDANGQRQDVLDPATGLPQIANDFSITTDASAWFKGLANQVDTAIENGDGWGLARDGAWGATHGAADGLGWVAGTTLDGVYNTIDTAVFFADLGSSRYDISDSFGKAVDYLAEDAIGSRIGYDLDSSPFAQSFKFAGGLVGGGGAAGGVVKLTGKGLSKAGNVFKKADDLDDMVAGGKPAFDAAASASSGGNGFWSNLWGRATRSTGSTGATNSASTANPTILAGGPAGP